MKTILGWVVTLLVLIGCAAAIEAGLGVGTTTTTGGGPKVSKLDDELWAISQRVAVSQGDPSAYDREAVGPLPLGRAALLTTGDGPLGATTSVYVIELRGHFVCDACSGPRGAAAPTGSVTILYVDASNLESVGGGLSDTWYDLDRLGRAFPLIAPPGGLTLLQQHPFMAAYVGTWLSRGGVLTVDVSGGEIRFGGPDCPVTDGGRPACSTITFRVSGDVLSTNPPGLARLYRGAEPGCADGGQCGTAVAGIVETDDVGLRAGAQVELWGEPNHSLELVVSGRPTIPVPTYWCGPGALPLSC